MKRLTTILCGLWAAMVLCAGPAHAEKRVALVIGNSDYQNASKLANPVNDAKAMAEMFRQAGFEVVEAKTDLGNLEFKRVAREFTAIARDADIAVMYFAGHGIEVNGTNYLLPVDAKLAPISTSRTRRCRSIAWRARWNPRSGCGSSSSMPAVTIRSCAPCSAAWRRARSRRALPRSSRRPAIR